jgi:stage III sporulation protein AG
MEVIKEAKELLKNRKWAVLMTVCGIAGLLLIMISSLLPDKKPAAVCTEQQSVYDSSDYCKDTEKRLADLLREIEGAGEVKVYLTVGSEQRYVYATEGRQSRSDNKTEEEEKYVIVGGGSEKNALVETIEAPKITGAVIVCGGGGDAAVREQIYKAASAALGIPTAKIYVAKIR